jgi:Pectinesterase
MFTKEFTCPFLHSIITKINTSEFLFYFIQCLVFLTLICFSSMYLCREQVKIPREKQFILLEGQGMSTTVIQWNAHTQPGDAVIGTAAFIVSADNFIARHITFQV